MLGMFFLGHSVVSNTLLEFSRLLFNVSVCFYRVILLVYDVSWCTTAGCNQKPRNFCTSYK